MRQSWDVSDALSGAMFGEVWVPGASFLCSGFPGWVSKPGTGKGWMKSSPLHPGLGKRAHSVCDSGAGWVGGNNLNMSLECLWFTPSLAALLMQITDQEGPQLATREGSGDRGLASAPWPRPLMGGRWGRGEGESCSPSQQLPRQHPGLCLWLVSYVVGSRGRKAGDRTVGRARVMWEGEVEAAHHPTLTPESYIWR